MTALNSKLFHRLLLSILFIVGCSISEKPRPPHKCQAIVVVDKTNSVNYTDRLPKLQGKFKRIFELTYAAGESNIQSSILVITGKTRVFPDFDYFGENCPEVDLDSRPGQMAWQRWNMDKRKWISGEVRQVISLIESPCNSNTTDILSIFSGIQQAQKRNGPWDSVNVFIFSDMINTCSPINMLREISAGNARDKGKRICRDLIAHDQLSAGNTGNLYLTIYTPENMEVKTDFVYQFWVGFFEQWGLGEDHYHFE